MSTVLINKRRKCSYCGKKRYSKYMIFISYPLIHKKSCVCNSCYEKFKNHMYIVMSPQGDIL